MCEYDEQVSAQMRKNGCCDIRDANALCCAGSAVKKLSVLLVVNKAGLVRFDSLEKKKSNKGMVSSSLSIDTTTKKGTKKTDCSNLHCVKDRKSVV